MRPKLGVRLASFCGLACALLLLASCSDNAPPAKTVTPADSKADKPAANATAMPVEKVSLDVPQPPAVPKEEAVPPPPQRQLEGRPGFASFASARR